MRYRRGGVVAAALLAVALAGCIGGGPTDNASETDLPTDASEATPDKPQPESEATVQGEEVPSWERGQWWTFSVAGDGETREETFVVAHVEPEKYMVKSDSREAVFINARNPVSFMGHQRRSDLAGSQGEHSIKFFQWPLTEDASWSTVWDGVEREINVTAVDESGDVPEYRLTAYDPEGRKDVEYTYSPAAEWFTSLTYYDDAGETMWDLTLADYGLNYNGSILSLELTTAIDATFGPGPDGAQFTTDGGDAEDDYWVRLNYSAPGPAAMGMGHGTSNGTIDPFFNETCASTCNGTRTLTRAPEPATWGGGILQAPAAGGTMDVLVYLRDFTSESL